MISITPFEWFVTVFAMVVAGVNIGMFINRKR